MTPDFEHAYELAVQEKENQITKSCELVMSMDQDSLSELRCLQRPPADIEELLVAVITILKGISADFSWTKGAKRLMANLDRLVQSSSLRSLCCSMKKELSFCNLLLPLGIELVFVQAIRRVLRVLFSR